MENTILELVEGYAAYSQSAELGLDATAEAPAIITTVPCVIYGITTSSTPCAAAAGAYTATALNAC